MTKFAEKYVQSFMTELIAKNPGETEFHQAVKEVLTSVVPVLEAYPTTRARSTSTAVSACR